MSERINDGGPAFPVSPEIYNGTGLCGMSLRDWFAGQALQSYLAGRNKDDRCTISGTVAVHCYGYADAMIAARGGDK